MLSRTILAELNAGLNEENIRELFLLFGQRYAEVVGNTPQEKVEGFVLQLQRQGRLLELRDAVRSIKTSIHFPDE